MEDLFRLDETNWQVGKNIYHIPLLHKKKDEKGRMKRFNEGELVVWMLRATKIKGVKFSLPWRGPLKYKKCLITTLCSCQP